MKRTFLFIFALSFALTGGTLFAKDKSNSNTTLRKSTYSDTYLSTKSGNTSYPAVNGSNVPSSVTATPQISTGYYFLDSYENVNDYWKPSGLNYTYDSTSAWIRIQAGPRVMDSTYWNQHPELGMGFFRNPALPTNGSFFTGGTDSTVNAFAGPIPIGFSFILNGIRYDSFYVSTHGLITLSNRRYYYDLNGKRTVPVGSLTGAYDPMSEDWFEDSWRKRDFANSLTDNTPDDFGYNYNACGGTTSSNFYSYAKTQKFAGIRDSLYLKTCLKDFGRVPVIAPFFGNVCLSQAKAFGDSTIQDDYSKVFYRRSESGKELYIYFNKILPRGTFTDPTTQLPYTFVNNSRPGTDINYCDASAYVVMNSVDSSVTFYYEFNGGITITSASGDYQYYSSADIFKYTTIAGINGRARGYVPDPSTAASSTYPYAPWKFEYAQTTTYNDNLVSAKYPFSTGMWTKFKQWKNALRPTSIIYYTRVADPASGPAYSVANSVNNFEILAGDDRLGVIQPAVIIQNLSNDAQGPYSYGLNYQQQNLNCRVRFIIKNSSTNDIVYSRYLTVNSTALAAETTSVANFAVNGDSNAYVRICNSTGVPISGVSSFTPYSYAIARFPLFTPNELVDAQIGRMICYAIVEDIDEEKALPVNEQWKFDDTLNLNLTVMKRLKSFDDNFSKFSYIDGSPIPDVNKWVNIEGRIVNAEEHTFSPLSPRQLSSAINATDIKIQSPVLEMDRYTLSGTDEAVNGVSAGGDELRSFPIDLSYNKTLYSSSNFKPVFSFSYHRGKKMVDANGNIGNYRGDWTETTMYGPEHRVLQASYGTGDFRYSNIGKTYAADSLVVDFALPNDPTTISRTCNLQETDWNTLPQVGANPILKTPYHFYSIFGGGGYRRAYHKNYPDSLRIYPADSTLYYDVADVGFDDYYQNVSIIVPNNYITYKGVDNKNFRFRFKNFCWNNTRNYKLGYAVDDNDPFYIDNIRLIMTSDQPDVEVSAVTIVWPYTKFPASQATQLPLTVVISNNAAVDARNVLVSARISKASDIGKNKYVYCRNLTIPLMTALTQSEFTLPNWNAQKSPDNTKYIVEVSAIPANGDSYSGNNYNYLEYDFKTDSVLAYDYDYANNAQYNDVPKYRGVKGRGLSMPGAQYDGVATGDPLPLVATQFYSGYEGGKTSGQIAVRYNLYQADSIFGFESYFGSANQSPDAIAFAVYSDNGNWDAPSGLVANSEMVRYRGLGIKQVSDNTPAFNQYVSYRYTRPIYLEAGVYWMVVSQQGQTGLELGATLNRMGSKLMYICPKRQNDNYNGDGNITLMLDKSLRFTKEGGNQVMASFENIKGSGTWAPFNPTTGNYAYHFLNWTGVGSAAFNGGATSYMARSTFLPLLRTFTKQRTAGLSTTYVECNLPVELASFDGSVRNKNVDLYWQTSSEYNNQGFRIERREVLNSDKTSDWTSAGFVKSQGSSSVATDYNFIDNTVSVGKTYQYRLRHIDNDNTISCEDFSKVLTLTVESDEAVSLAQNSPNPFDNSTNFSFTLKNSALVSLDVVDLFGATIKNIYNGELSANTYENFSWDGKLASGVQATDGVYFLRLTAGNVVRTVKMSLVK